MAAKLPTLVSPDGVRTWTPETPTQATDLRARGWKPEPVKPAPKTADK